MNIFSLNIFSQLNARVARARAPARGEQGAILGFILTVIILIVLVVVAFNKLSAGDSSSNGSKQQARMDAATLINQSGEFRNSYNTMLSEIDNPASWLSLGDGFDGLRLINATAADATLSPRPVPVGPIGSNGSVVRWKVSGATANGTFAFTSDNLSAAMCTAVNAALGVTIATNAAVVTDMTAAVVELTDAYGTYTPATPAVLAVIAGLPAMGGTACVSNGTAGIVVSKISS